MLKDAEKNPAVVEVFITRWEKSGAAERSNYALFLSEFCDLIGVSRPDLATLDNAENSYVIDWAVTRLDKDGKKTTVYLNLYKSGHFVLETKQGSSAETSSLRPCALLNSPAFLPSSVNRIYQVSVPMQRSSFTGNLSP